EMEGLRRQVEEGRVEAARVQADAERLEGDAAARAAALARVEADLGGAREALAAATGEPGRARAAIGRAPAAGAGHENNARSLDRRRSDLDLRAGRLGEEEARVGARGAELIAEIAAHEARLGELRQSRTEREQDRAAHEARLASLKLEHGAAEADA